MAKQKQFQQHFAKTDRQDYRRQIAKDTPAAAEGKRESAEENLKKAILNYMKEYNCNPDLYYSMQFCFINDLVLLHDKPVDERIDPTKGFHEIGEQNG